MQFPEAMMHETIWFERPSYEAERENYELYLTKNLTMQVSKGHGEQGLLSRATTAVAQAATNAGNALIHDIAEIRDSIKQTLSGVATQVQHAVTAETDEHLSSVEKENKDLRSLVNTLCEQVKKLDARVTVLEANAGQPTVKVSSSEPPAKKVKIPQTEPPTKKPKVGDDDTSESKPVESKKEDSDSDDLFGSDDESETEEEKAENERRKAELVKKYEAKKAKKPQVVAKSSVLFDVKPWDDETDMVALEKCVRSIELDGLLWGASKLVPLAYGIKKLQISSVIEDEKVSTDDLQEKIAEFDDYIQSSDIAAFNKI